MVVAMMMHHVMATTALGFGGDRFRPVGRSFRISRRLIGLVSRRLGGRRRLARVGRGSFGARRRLISLCCRVGRPLSRVAAPAAHRDQRKGQRRSRQPNQFRSFPD
jgi:hypothetical protein